MHSKQHTQAFLHFIHHWHPGGDRTHDLTISCTEHHSCLATSAGAFHSYDHGCACHQHSSPTPLTSLNLSLRAFQLQCCIKTSPRMLQRAQETRCWRETRHRVKTKTTGDKTLAHVTSIIAASVTLYANTMGAQQRGCGFPLATTSYDWGRRCALNA